MGTNSKIQWTDNTWNPWRGCTKVSDGCKNCYMERDLKRFGNDPEVVRRASDATFYAPLAKTRNGWKWPDGDKVFACSWADFFHPAADEYRAECWNIIKRRPGLTFQLLTKRPERFAMCLPKDWGAGYPNVWLGVTAENQAMVNRRIPILLDVPASVRFASLEPLLWETRLDGFGHSLDWVIVGGETGAKARPILDKWVRLIRDYCFQVDLPLFVKQLARKRPIPDDLAIFEFPLERSEPNSMDAYATANQAREREESERRLREITLKERVDLLPDNAIRAMVFDTVAGVVRTHHVRAQEAIDMRRFARARVIADWDEETRHEHP